MGLLLSISLSLHETTRSLEARPPFFHVWAPAPTSKLTSGPLLYKLHGSHLPEIPCKWDPWLRGAGLQHCGRECRLEEEVAVQLVLGWWIRKGYVGKVLLELSRIVLYVTLLPNRESNLNLLCHASYLSCISFYVIVFYTPDQRELCSIHSFYCFSWHSKDLANVSRDEIKWLKNIIFLIFNLKERFEHMSITFTSILG